MPRPSGDDVRRELILDVGNTIAQLELALLQALDLKLVGAGGVLQGRDGDIEVAVLLLQSRQLLLQLPLFLFVHALLAVDVSLAYARKYQKSGSVARPSCI